MKKVLLFVVAAFVAGSASAQKSSARNLKAASSIQLPAPQMKMTDQVPALTHSKFKLGRYQGIPSENVNFIGVKPMRNIASTPRRAAEFAKAYTGTATNYRSKAAETWTMTPSSLSDGTPCLVDVIPTPFSNTSLSAIYSVDGSSITIPAQKVAEASYKDKEGASHPLYCYLINPLTSSTDGSMHLTLGDDGSLTSVEGYIAYYFFLTDEYKFSNEDGTSNVYSSMIYTSVKYLEEGKIVAPVAMYEPDFLYLHAFMTRDRNWYGTNNYGILPAFASVPYKNMTTDLADAWRWTALDGDSVAVAEGTERDFSFNTIGGEAYMPPVLIGMNQDAASEPYRWGLVNSCTKSYLFAGETQSGFGDDMIIGRASPDNSYAYYGFLGTPDVNSQEYSIERLILYQGKPTAPFYFTGVSLFVKDFVAKENFALTCQIVKATRSASGSLVLGDTIAQADVRVDSIYVNDGGQTTLYWTDFYVVDEYGMSETIDHIFVEDEFVVIFDGWDNGTFSAIPYGEYYTNENASISTYGKDTGDSSIYKYTEGNMMLGFIDAAYGYLYTTDNTNLTIANAGGDATIHVVPMLHSIDSEGNRVTRLFLESVATNDEEEILDAETGLPTWIGVSLTNPAIVGEEADGTPQYSSEFDMTFSVEALPEGVTGRQATLVFYQEGAQLKVTVTQGEVTGIAAAKAEVKAGNAQMFNLAGQRVSNSYKGLVIKNGKKMLNK